jgi:hypothetical protein
MLILLIAVAVLMVAMFFIEGGTNTFDNNEYVPPVDETLPDDGVTKSSSTTLEPNASPTTSANPTTNS